MIKAIALLLLVVSWFISITNCQIGIWRFENATTATLKCMVSQGISNLMYLIMSPPPQTINQDLYQIKNSGMGTDIQFIFLPDEEESPFQQVKRFVDIVLPGLIDRVWILPFWLYTGQNYWQSNIKLINQYAKLFAFNGYKTGIVTSKKVWQTTTNNTKYFNTFPLGWLPQNQDDIPSFDDYQPFGGWQKPAIKFFTSKTICGIEEKSLYYEP